MAVKTALRSVMAVSAALFWAGNAAPGTSQFHKLEGGAGPRPALWKLSDQDTRIYLFGTTHALPRNFAWRTTKFDAIAKRADELVLETTQDQVTSASDQRAMQAILDEASLLPALSLRVPVDKRKKLTAAMRQSTTPLSDFNDMPTWMASFVLTMDDMERLGLNQAYGVEAALEVQFKMAKKPVHAVDKGNRTLRRLDAMSHKAQSQMLADVVDDLGDPHGEAAASDRAWAEGNVELLGKHFNEKELGAELFDALVRKRNLAWSDWLKGRMEKPGTVLFAVGAGHMAGPESLIRLLQKQGLSATRIQ